MYLWSYRGLGKGTFSNDTFKIVNVKSDSIDEFENILVKSNFPLFKDRRIKISGYVKNINLLGLRLHQKYHFMIGVVMGHQGLVMT